MYALYMTFSGWHSFTAKIVFFSGTSQFTAPVQTCIASTAEMNMQNTESCGIIQKSHAKSPSESSGFADSSPWYLMEGEQAQPVEIDIAVETTAASEIESNISQQQDHGYVKGSDVVETHVHYMNSNELSPVDLSLLEDESFGDGKGTVDCFEMVGELNKQPAVQVERPKSVEVLELTANVAESDVVSLDDSDGETLDFVISDTESQESQSIIEQPDNMKQCDNNIQIACPRKLVLPGNINDLVTVKKECIDDGYPVDVVVNRFGRSRHLKPMPHPISERFVSASQQVTALFIKDRGMRFIEHCCTWPSNDQVTAKKQKVIKAFQLVSPKKSSHVSETNQNSSTKKANTVKNQILSNCAEPKCTSRSKPDKENDDMTSSTVALHSSDVGTNLPKLHTKSREQKPSKEAKSPCKSASQPKKIQSPLTIRLKLSREGNSATIVDPQLESCPKSSVFQADRKSKSRNRTRSSADPTSSQDHQSFSISASGDIDLESDKGGGKTTNEASTSMEEPDLSRGNIKEKRRRHSHDYDFFHSSDEDGTKGWLLFDSTGEVIVFSVPHTCK